MIELKLVDEKGDKQRTIVQNEDDIISFSISYDFNNDETIALAFNSDVELYREKGFCSEEYMSNIINDFYDFEINRDIRITKDNIADYYEFMSDEEKITHKDALYNIHADRYKNIRQSMIEDGLIFETNKGIDNDAVHFNRDARKFNQNTVTYYYDISYFGIKDTLKPIDEYIKDIKASVLYQEYVNTKSVDTNLFLANNNKPLSIKEISLTLYNDENIIMKDFENKRLLSIEKNYDGELMYRIYDENVDYDSELDIVKNPEIALQYGVIEVVEKENEEYDLPEEAIQQIISKVKESVDASPSIDECLEQIEKEETAKASTTVGMK